MSAVLWQTMMDKYYVWQVDNGYLFTAQNIETGSTWKCLWGKTKKYGAITGRFCRRHRKLFEAGIGLIGAGLTFAFIE